MQIYILFLVLFFFIKMLMTIDTLFNNEGKIAITPVLIFYNVYCLLSMLYSTLVVWRHYQKIARKNVVI